MRWRITMVVLCVLMQCVAMRAWAQATTKPVQPDAGGPAQSPPLKQLVYNVSELIRVAEDYPLQPAMIPSTRLPGAGMIDGRGGFVPGGGAEGPGAAPEVAAAKPPATTVEAISQLIRDTVDPASWAENGGIANIRAFGRSLIISQTEETHKQIKALLEQLQKEAAPTRMVSVRAYWVLLDATDLPKLGDRAKAEKKSAAMLEVPPEMITDSNIYSQGQTLCFNGQTVHISSGRGRTVITGASPVVGQSSVGYQFSTEVVQNGVALQVKPDVTPDGKSAVLDLQSIVSELPEAKAATAPAAGTPTSQPSDVFSQTPIHAIDRVNVVAQQFRTTVRIPLDKKILIGGMTMEPNNAGASARNLYLVVEVNAGD